MSFLSGFVKGYREVKGIYRLLGTITEGYLRCASKMPWGLIRGLSKWSGLILSGLPWSRRRVALENMKTLVGDPEEAKRLYRKTLEHFFRVALEMPFLYTMDSSSIKRLYGIRGKEHVWEAYEKGRGILLLTAHLGNWELLNIAFAIEFLLGGGYKASIVVRALDNPVIDLLSLRLRSRFGTRVIDKKNAMRGILKALRENQAVGILLDQNVDWYQGVFVRFLGRWTCTNKGMAQIALKTNAPVIPAFGVRKENFYELNFYPPLRLIQSGDPTKDVEENTQLFTSVIEDEIRRYPDQWLWFHRRWKTRQYSRLW
ncbi:MAG: lysophospholipid acyltransferase family protein [Desulfatiglandales bacterium]